MLVKYIGRLPALTTEYNGKKYCFSKENPVQDIDPKIYDSLRSSGHVNSNDVIFFEDGYKEKIAKLEQRIVELERLLNPKEVKRGKKRKQ